MTNYILLNVAYGNGPYCRATELAIQVNKRLQEQGKPQLKIIVPWIYGETQKRIMYEEFAQYIKDHPQHILLDKTFGTLLNEVFFQGDNYEENLKLLVEKQGQVEQKVIAHFKQSFTVEDMEGNQETINPQDIAFELCRNPRVLTGIKKGFYTSIAYFSEILEELKKEHKINPELADQVLPIAKKLEDHYQAHFLPEPSTFTFKQQANQEQKRSTETTIPPTITPQQTPQEGQFQNGMYVLVSGIPKLIPLYKKAEQVAKVLNLKIYCNKNGIFDDAIIVNPHVIGRSEIKVLVARSGWSAMWTALLLEKPLLVLPYEDFDDPEIYFNAKTLQMIKLGTVLDNRDPNTLQKQAQENVEHMKQYKQQLLEKYGTLDGNEFASKVIISQI